MREGEFLFMVWECIPFQSLGAPHPPAWDVWEKRDRGWNLVAIQGVSVPLRVFVEMILV